jgi:hypothetical protein
MAQGVLPIQYEADGASSGVTALGGLLVYQDLIKISGLSEAIKKYVTVSGKQGWLDLQMILAVIFLNLAGGDCVDDLERLEHDGGFALILREIERFLLTRKERQAMKARWRRKRTRALPSPSSMSEWLERFHSRDEEARREKGTAFIPAMTEHLRSLWRVNRDLLGFVQKHRPETEATLDMDATLVAGHKRNALFCYKGFKGYQPLNCWWAEQGVMVHSEFRDGNVPAGHEQLRVLKICLDEVAALGVTKVSLRSDSAGYQQDLLLYCGEGKDERFGVIDFAVSADVTQEFRKAVQEVKEADWHRLVHTFDDGTTMVTDQEWAEVCYVPGWAGHSKTQADYRFLAIREPLRQLNLGDADLLPFPTEEFGAKGRYKLFGVVTNRKIGGDQVIWWLRERCGKSEEVHSVMKSDLAGGQMPSGLFGANAAWWTIMILAHNLNAAMKRLVLGPAWVAKRMKALRFALINLPGRVVNHARRLVIRISAAGDTLAMLLAARRTIQAMARAPAG